MTRTPAAALALVLGLAEVAGCSGADTRPATWSYISPAILQPACATASCHSPASAVSGLDFSTVDSGYTSLTRLWVWIVVAPDAGAPPAGVPCATVDGTFVCERMLRPLVTPFDPGGSRLVNMLRARAAPRMPPDRPLPEADIELVERWVLNGACRSGLSCNADASSFAPDAADGPRAAGDARTDAGTDLGGGG